MLSLISDNDCARNYGSGQLAPRIAFFELKNRLQNARKARFFMQFFVIQGEPLPCPEVRAREGHFAPIFDQKTSQNTTRAIR